MRATKREYAIMQAITGLTFLAGPNWDYFMNYVKEKFGRDVSTAELIQLKAELKSLAQNDFEEMCQRLEYDG